MKVLIVSSRPDRRLRRRQEQLALQVHQERVQPGVEVNHWRRVRHKEHPGSNPRTFCVWAEKMRIPGLLTNKVAICLLHEEQS